MTGQDLFSDGLVVRSLAVPGQWPFGTMPRYSYDLLMVDPPWPTQMRSRKGELKSSVAKYGAMPWAEIEALPVGQLAAPRSALFLWATWPHLLYGGDPARHFEGADASLSKIGRCIKAWGYRYVTGGGWLKRKSKGALAYGTGYRFRSTLEPWLFAVRGDVVTTSNERNFIDDFARDHSRKPEKAYALCERIMPGAQYAELFSRTPRAGWDTWGFEAGKFEPTVTLNADPLEGQAA